MSDRTAQINASPLAGATAGPHTQAASGGASAISDYFQQLERTLHAQRDGRGGFLVRVCDANTN